MARWFRKHFLGGILTLVPLLVVAFLFNFGIGWLENLYHWIPEGVKPSGAAPRFIFFLGYSATVLIGIAVLGWASKNYLGQRMLKLFGRLIAKIPIVGTVYGSLTQLIDTLTKGGGKQFRRVVFIRYPHADSLAVAFVTGPSNLKGIPKGYLNVFIPAVPNPTSGFHLLIAEENVIESDLTVEQAFQLILSLGLAPPKSGSRS
jgi:uncharacterized membrane protein